MPKNICRRRGKMDTNNDNESTFSYSELLDCLKSAFFLIGVALALFVWILDPFIDAVFLQQGTIYQQLTQLELLEIYIRSVISAIIIIFSFIGSALLNRSRQAEEALQQSHYLLSSVIEGTGDQIYVKDIEGRYVLVNKATAHYFGKSVTDIIGKTNDDLMLPDVARVANLEDKEVLSTGTPHNYEHSLEKEGKAITRLKTKSVYRDSEGNPLGVVGISKDITERKQAEEVLRESHKFLNAIIEEAPDFIFAKDLEGRYTVINSAAARAVGKPVEDIIGKTNFDLFPPDLARKLDEEDKNVLLTGKTHSFEQSMEIDGSTRTLLTTKYSHFDSEGNPVGILGIGRDITERKLAEEKIRHLANHDELTGLPTLRLGRDRLSGAIALARRNKTSAAVLYLDLDGFKEVNDSLGHKAGDHVLIEVGERLTQSVRETDTVARLGGDEFIIVLTQVTEETAYVMVAEKVIKTLTRPIGINGQDVNISASIGIALYPDHGDTTDELIKQADGAMYGVKRKGKNNYAIA